METAPTRTTVHRLILLAVVCGMTTLMARHAAVRPSDLAGVSTRLPDTVGAWTGDELFFCQAMTCQWAGVRSELNEPANCPRCGSVTSSGSPVEWMLLPRDTHVTKKLYRQPGQRPLVAAIILSGRDRASIHRPQICLVGEGQEITATHRTRIPISTGGSLPVTILELLRQRPSPNGPATIRRSIFAYWFVGPHHVTDAHLVRMFWMGIERIFRGVSHRWAYISVAGGLTDAQPEYRSDVEEFIRDLYPQVVLPAPLMVPTSP